jgi:hypothetical protein
VKSRLALLDPFIKSSAGKEAGTGLSIDDSVCQSPDGTCAANQHGAGLPDRGPGPFNS